MTIVDKSGALEDIRGRVLDIGCGTRKKDDAYVGVDLLDGPGVDIVGEVGEVLARIGDGELGGVYSSHFLEHVEDVPALVRELARVIGPGGRLEVVVPHFANPYYYSDPTHRTTFGLYSFSYLAVDEVLTRKVPSYSRELEFAVKSIYLDFKSPKPFYGRYLLRRPFGGFVNLTAWTQELYEENLCYMVPCYELRFMLVRRGA